jgi:hypothetical protein
VNNYREKEKMVFVTKMRVALLDPYRNVLLLLLRVADEKMSYYQKKYNPEASLEDQFLVEDVIDFARAAFTYKVRAAESAEVGRSHISGQ